MAGKKLFIAEKPSVAMEFAKTLGETMSRHNGYQESANNVVTWCVGHLVTMSYPEVYDEKYRRWRLDTLPFMPETFLYEIIPSVKDQFQIVSGLLNRKDIETIYVCTDSGREGEYIYRLVAQMANVHHPDQRRVWIDSQTEEEIRRGIRDAKPLEEYDHLGESAYLRAKEDYLMGINFSRLLTLKYGRSISDYLGEKHAVISVGRVMTCVLGMVVRREREIRDFVKTPFYRVCAPLSIGPVTLDAEWRAAAGSKYAASFHTSFVPEKHGTNGQMPSAYAKYEGSPKLYKENGFSKKEDALRLIEEITQSCREDGHYHEGSPENERLTAVVTKAEKKTEKKNPPLLYNLAELQNDCSRMFRISPDQTLSIVQELYEKKLVTYPRTDARVLSTAVAKEIHKNLSGLCRLEAAAAYASSILEENRWQQIGKSRYTNDKQITDHYAIIPTGQGLPALKSLNSTAYGVYMTIVRRFLRIFYPPAQYQKVNLQMQIGREPFFAGFRILQDPGYLSVMPDKKKNASKDPAAQAQTRQDADPEDGSEEKEVDLNDPDAAAAVLGIIGRIRKGSELLSGVPLIREGETSPPKRYNSGTMILAMENAGSLIEDEELRAQIKGSGIGTSATRAEILKKLVSISYLNLNKKTQILTPTQKGEMVYDVVRLSIAALLNPDLTASWEKGLTMVAEGTITGREYMDKLEGFISRRTENVLARNMTSQLRGCYDAASSFYKKKPRAASSAGKRKPEQQPS